LAGGAGGQIPKMPKYPNQVQAPLNLPYEHRLKSEPGKFQRFNPTLSTI
jgi:hypothetical protein